MSDSSQQWLSEGNCIKCRKQTYCGKPCTAFKRVREEAIRRKVIEKTGLTDIADGLMLIHSTHSS